MKKDELRSGYSLDDFGVPFKERQGQSLHLKKPHFAGDSAKDSANVRDFAKDSAKNAESANNFKKNAESASNYAPQFEGFNAIFEQNAESNKFAESSKIQTKDSANPPKNAESTRDSAPNAPKNPLDSAPISHAEKRALLHPLPQKQSDINALFVALAMLFLILLIFIPQVYLANNIYSASKNINYLKTQKEALRDENSDLQKQLESLKFNFLTLEIEEIK
ncbi:hypothetical protein ACWIUD_10805 [Helicobacter sp. 23-1044]